MYWTVSATPCPICGSDCQNMPSMYKGWQPGLQRCRVSSGLILSLLAFIPGHHLPCCHNCACYAPDEYGWFDHAPGYGINESVD